jgi:hypothetical protein
MAAFEAKGERRARLMHTVDPQFEVMGATVTRVRWPSAERRVRRRTDRSLSVKESVEADLAPF